MSGHWVQNVPDDLITAAPRLVLDRDEETAREERWANFIGWCRLEIMQHGLTALLLAVGMASIAQRCDRLVPTCAEREILGFAKDCGFHGVLQAVAEAVKAEERS